MPVFKTLYPFSAEQLPSFHGRRMTLSSGRKSEKYSTFFDDVAHDYLILSSNTSMGALWMFVFPPEAAFSLAGAQIIQGQNKYCIVG